MLEKIIPAGSWDFGIEPVEVIKVARQGFRGDDRRNFLVKRAASNVFADLIDKLAVAKDELPIHAIAIGATEGYLCNRNGDAFNEKTCQARHHTFVSKPLSQVKKGEHGGARLYEHHRNKDPRTSYGYVKASAYDREMRRIELLLLANLTKAAAERNGGQVLPDSWREKLAGADLTGFSMATRLPFDVCSVCHNKAANRSEYCDAETCISETGYRGFGCRHGLTKVSATGRQQYVENPNCTFFDFSLVDRPADRTAYGGVADYLQKAASAGLVIGGAELAEKFAAANGYAISSGDNPKLREALQIIQSLAACEASLEKSATFSDLTTALAFAPEVTDADFPSLGEPGRQKYAGALLALARRGVLLQPADFIKISQPNISSQQLASCAAAMTQQLPGIYGRLANLPQLAEQLADVGLYKLAEAMPSFEQTLVAEKLAKTRSFCLSDLSSRAQLAAARGCCASALSRLAGHAKQAAASNAPAEQLARQYSLLKVAMLCYHPKPADFPLTLRAVSLSNYF